MKFAGVDKRSSEGRPFSRDVTCPEGSSATVVLAAAVGILFVVEEGPTARREVLSRRTFPNEAFNCYGGQHQFKQPFLAKLGKNRFARLRLWCSERMRLMPNVLGIGRINSVLGNVGRVIANTFQAPANKKSD